MNSIENNKGTPTKHTDNAIYPEIPSTSVYDDDNIPEIDTQNEIPIEMPGRNDAGEAKHLI